ncbi:MAG: tetratricopeptide repeat protein [Phycisphaerales bacterium]|nr:tetratricopeptide repeat protein [Phycisphaerales bacterium]
MTLTVILAVMLMGVSGFGCKRTPDAETATVGGTSSGTSSGTTLGGSSGAATIPAPDLSGMEAALVRRINELRGEVAANPGSAEAWGQLAIGLEVHGMIEDAIPCYREAGRLDPTDVRWPYFEGIANAVGNQDASLELFLRALELQDDYAPLHVQLAHLYLMRGDVDSAVKHYDRADELDPTLIRIPIGKAEVALARDDAETALQLLERAGAMNPVTDHILINLAETYRRLGRTEQAAAVLASVGTGQRLEPLPDPLRTQWQWDAGVTTHWRAKRSDAYLGRGQVDRAREEWNELIRLDPDSAIGHAQLGMVSVHANELPRAIPHLQRALEIDPTQYEIQSTLGLAFVKTGETEKGLNLLESAARKLGTTKSAMSYASALRDLRRWDEAEAAFREAVAAHPDDPEARFEHGVMLGRSGRHAEAAGAFARVADADPDYRGVQSNLARSLYRSGAVGDAVKVLRTALARNSTDAQLRNDLAWMLATGPDASYRNGAEAIRLITPLCEQTNFQNPMLLNTLAAACAEAGKFDEAVRHATRAAEVAGSTPQYRGMVPALRQRLALYEQEQPYRGR